MREPEMQFKWKVRDVDPNAVEIREVDASALSNGEKVDLTIPKEIVGKESSRSASARLRNILR